MIRFRPGRATWVALAAATVVALMIGRGAGRALVVEQPVASPDAILSLASHEWERLPETARLAKKYPNARVLITLPQVVNEFNCHDCGSRVSRLSARGVARERIHILPLTASGTYGEAVATKTYEGREPFSRLLVVTSPYHTRRSLATFRAVFAGTDVAVGIQPALATSPSMPDAWWWTSYDRWYVRYEWSAIPYYRVRYGIDALPRLW